MLYALSCLQAFLFFCSSLFLVLEFALGDGHGFLAQEADVADEHLHACDQRVCRRLLLRSGQAVPRAVRRAFACGINKQTINKNSEYNSHVIRVNIVCETVLKPLKVIVCKQGHYFSMMVNITISTKTPP